MPETFVRIGDFRCFPLTDGALPYPKDTIGRHGNAKVRQDLSARG